MPFYTDVVFIISSLTIFRKPCYGCMIFFLSLRVLLPASRKILVFVDDPKQKAVKDKQKQVVTGWQRAQEKDEVNKRFYSSQ